MSQNPIKITLTCEPDVEKDVENAFFNSGIQFTKEEVKTPTEAYHIYIPEAIWSLSVALHILEAKKDDVKGNVELPDGRKFELDDEGRAKLGEVLTEAMSRKREMIVPEIPWWTPFIPEIKGFLRQIISFMEWYPKAYGEGKRIVTRNFLLLISAIIIGLWLLTFFDKISGDSFVFVIGALIGYIFAFLQRFLGILAE